MVHAELRLSLPGSVWIGAFSRAHPEARLRILAALADEDAGVGLVEITADDLPSVVRDFRSRPEVTEVDLLQQRDTTALLQFETAEPILLLPVQGSNVPLEMPFVIEDGEAEWEITAPRDRLSALAEQLDAFDITYHVERIGERFDPDRLLTDRQQRLIRTAVEAGYYDTPRGCSLTELAEEAGLAKSTVSETLHRAEGRIVKRFVEEMEERIPEFG